MSRKNPSNDENSNRPAFGTQLPGSFGNMPESASDETDLSSDSTPVSGPAHGTLMAPPAALPENRAARPAASACEAVTRTYAPGDADVGRILLHAQTQQRAVAVELPDAEGFATKTRASSGKPKQPSAGKSTWNLRIRERGVAGHISGVINKIPTDPSQVTGLLSALAGNDALPEYEVLGELGAGSMGVVYRARQTSLNRDLAIKTLKPGLSNPDYDQAMFVSEAVVTAHLVHPNIVPIHDLGRTADGKLFYSMKEVTGTPWHQNIQEMTLEQNLDIFLKVCDGVSFAHSRGVINRDLKPENVIIGDYGEVVVLDWGLALTTDGFARRDSVMLDFRGGGGTPVYMAPELAESDVSNVGTHTDVYLLGAMIFEILEGRGPHWLRQIEQMADPGEQLNAVIWAVLHNDIEMNVNNEGELMQIARKAMSTHPTDRYATVAELQDAIREYRITGRAEELMQKVESKKTTSYSEYQSAVALYDEALRKWPSNRRALDGDRKARKAYAELALQKGDVDLGLQILPERTDRDFEPVRKKLKSTRRNRSIMRGTWVLATVGAAFAAFVATLFYLDVVAAKNKLEESTGEIQQLEVKKVQLTRESDAAKAARDAATTAMANAERELATATQATIDAETDRNAATIAKVEAENDRNAAAIAMKKAQDAAASATKTLAIAKTDLRMANAAKDDAEQKASEAKAEIDSAKAEVATAQDAALQAFLERIDAKTTIKKFSEAADLISKEFQKESVNPSFIRKKEYFERLREKLAGKGDNKELEVNLRDSKGQLSADGSTLIIKSRRLLSVFRNVQTSPPQEHLAYELALTESSKRLAVSKSGNVICSVGRKDTKVWAWDGDRYRPIDLPEISKSLTVVSKCLISGDGAHLYLVGTRTNKETLVDVYAVNPQRATLVTQANLCEFMPNIITVTDAVLLPDESGLLLLTPQHNIRLIPMNWQQQIVRFTLHEKGDRSEVAYPLLPVDTAGGKEFAPDALHVSEDGTHVAVLEKGPRVIILKRNPLSSSAPFPYEAPNKVVTCNYGSPIRAVRFSADNSRLMVAQRRFLQIWDKAQGGWQLSDIDGLYEGHSLAGHTGEITVAGFLKGTSKRLLSCSEDNSIRLWNTDTYGDYVASVSGQKVAALPGSINSVAFASGGESDPETPMVISPLNSIAAPRYLLTGTQLTSTTQIARPALRFQQGRKIYSAEFSTDSERVVVGANDLAAHAFHTRNGKRTLTASMMSPRDPFFAPEKNNFVEGHIPEIVSLMFLPPKGELLLTFDYFGSLSVWDAKDDEDGIGFEKSRLLPNKPVDANTTGQPYEVEDPSCEISASQDGKWLIAGVVGNDGAASLEESKDEYFAAIWNTEDIMKSGQSVPTKELKAGYRNQITAAAISPNSKTAITATRRGSFVLWDIAAPKVLAQANGAHNSDGVSGIFYVSDSEFVSAGFDGGVLRWRIENGELIKTAIERPEGQTAPDFIIRLRPSPDGKRFVTSDLNRERKSKDYRLTLSHWSAEDGWQKLPVSISAPQSDLGRPYRHDISWSEDGQEILFVHDGKLVVLDATTLKPTEGFQLPRGNNAVRGAIAPKGAGGMRVATFDGRLAQLWDLSNGKHLADFRSHGPVVRAGFSADRKYVITASDSIRVFYSDEASPDHGLPVFRLPRKTAGPRLIEQVEFSTAQDDYRFASIDTTGRVRLWDWNPQAPPPSAASFDSGPDERDLAWMEDEEVTAANRLAWSPDGAMLGTVQRGKFRLWTVEDQKLTEIKVTLPADVVADNVAFNAIDFSPDSRRVVVGGVRWTDDEDVESWGVAFELDKQQCVPIAILEAEGGQRHSASKQGPATSVEPELRGITAIVFNDQADEIVTAGADSNILTWFFKPNEDTEGPEFIRPLVYREGQERQDGFVDPHAAPISAMDVAADGSLVSADESGWIVIWPPGR